jgi:hypothetical protein
MRAVADNRDLAAVAGIDVERMAIYVWIMAGGLAGLGGVMLALIQGPFEPGLGDAPLFLIFTTVVTSNDAWSTCAHAAERTRDTLDDERYVLDMGQNRMHGSGERLLNDREVIDLYLGNRGRLGVAALRLRQKVHTEV